MNVWELKIEDIDNDNDTGWLFADQLLAKDAGVIAEKGNILSDYGADFLARCEFDWRDCGVYTQRMWLKSPDYEKESYAREGFIPTAYIVQPHIVHTVANIWEEDPERPVDPQSDIQGS